ncbi:MAG: CoB--CoM heterodisulfide reductase subunit C [Methanobacteriaceae archaeon]|nr:CoB--CoM heterodisulfide reductase subunit C [Methanobacteriaceae archaeon]
MSFINRLKRVFTGEDPPEEKDKQEKSKKTDQPQAKTEIPKPPVEEKSEKTDAEIPKEEAPKKDEPAEEEKPAKSETSKPEKKEKTEPEAPEAKSEKPVQDKKKRTESMSLLNMEENKITRADIDPDFKKEVMDAGAESVAICFQCGTCTGACPSGRRTPYRIRQLVRRAVMGLKDDVISDDTIWMCTTCYECQERCPRAIKIVDVVKIVRNYAAQAGYMAPAHKMTGSFVIKTGHGVPINDATMALRKSVGLDKLPPTTHSFPEALEEVQKITKAAGFDKLIGYNWETGELE